jgi:hypothetical protein
VIPTVVGDQNLIFGGSVSGLELLMGTETETHLCNHGVTAVFSNPVSDWTS